jgi:hypothetical protein
VDLLIIPLSVVGAVVVALLVEQAKASAPSLASWVARLAASRLPIELRSSHAEEWAAVLEDLQGPLLKLATAIGFHFAIGGIMSEHLAGQKRIAAHKHDGQLGRNSEGIVPPRALLNNHEIWLVYSRVRNFTSHMSDPSSQESLQQIEEFLDQQTKGWSTAKQLQFYKTMAELLSRMRKDKD